jgi:error-prone DNA polymerase
VVNVWKARGDKFAHGGRPDPRDKARPVVRPKEMFDPDLRIETLKVKARNFH